MTGAGEGLSILESVDGQKWKNVKSSFESFITILILHSLDNTELLLRRSRQVK